jgi:thiamine biosynthesis lipoprotein ApbE
MMMSNKFLFIMMIAALSFGCSKTEERAKYEGRSETKKLQGADAAGYDGTAIRKSVDNTLNKTDQHNDTVDKSVKGEEGQK